MHVSNAYNHYHQTGFIYSRNFYGSISCASPSVPACFLIPTPSIPCTTLAINTDRGDASSESNSNHMYFLRSLEKQPVTTTCGLGQSSPPKLNKPVRGRQSYISKVIHRASMDDIEGRNLSLERVLRENGNPNMVPRQSVSLSIVWVWIAPPRN